MSGDTNFDPFVQRFEKNIYQSPKGQIRLKLLLEDLAAIPGLESGDLRVLDAGCGLANVSRQLAAKGHQLSLCDISEKMLQRVRQTFADLPDARADFHALSLQQLAEHFEQPFDLVMGHAVLEWLAEPRQGLQALVAMLAPGAYLSLMVYNKHSLPMRHLMRGNFYRIKRGALAGSGATLTPSNPLDPYEVEEWLRQAGLQITVRTGIRVFSDYMPRDLREQRSFEDVLEMEQRYARQPPFVYLGRYVHYLCRLPTC